MSQEILGHTSAYLDVTQMCCASSQGRLKSDCVSTQMSGCADSLVLTQGILATVVPFTDGTLGVEDNNDATQQQTDGADGSELICNCARLQNCF